MRVSVVGLRSMYGLVFRWLHCLSAGGWGSRLILGLMADCGQADLLNVVGDREKGVDPRLHLRLDCCVV